MIIEPIVETKIFILFEHKPHKATKRSLISLPWQKPPIIGIKSSNYKINTIMNYNEEAIQLGQSRKLVKKIYLSSRVAK